MEMELELLLKKNEGKTLEFKRDFSSPDRVVRALVAFANSAGGVLLFGIDDGDRSVRGVSDPTALEERLASVVTDSIAPMLVPHIQIIAWRNTHVVAVEVFPGASGPYYIKKLGPEKGVYVRVGSTNRKADPTLIQELYRQVHHTGFDEQPVVESNSEEVDFRVASELFGQVRTLTRSDLRTLKIVIKTQNRIVPTVGGMLLFGTTRSHYFPDAWIQCGRFSGTDRSKITDSAEYRDYIIPSIDSALNFVKKYSMHSMHIDGKSRHSENWTIPLTTAREAIVNAVVHADYSQHGMPVRISIFDDRMEVENPGLLPVGLTIEDILKGVSKLRNRVIARVFKELRLVEQWGSGVQRMLADCRNAGLPAPLFEEIATHFRVTVFLSRKSTLQIQNTDAELCALLKKGQAMTTAALSEKLGLSTRAVRMRVAKLVEQGVLTAIGTNPRDPRRKYTVREE